MNCFLGLALLFCSCLVKHGAEGQVYISEDEFVNGVTSNGFPTPTDDQYQGYIDSLGNAGISTKMEAAMFLAQMLHESGGLQQTREGGCYGPDDCADRYPASSEWVADCQGGNYPSGVSFYGRGYLQITWCSNYVQASQAMGNGDDLKWNPDSVATTPSLAWGVSAWFWGQNVHGALGGTDEFGLTTKAINGQTQECQGNGMNADASQQRFQYYTNVFTAYSLDGSPNPAGCNY